MIHLPGMLMVGACGRNVGKTELACALIRQASGDRPVLGIKVTTVDERRGTCPRGGRGCGVCASLEGAFCVTEERPGGPCGKDTVRMLSAGAERVFWLRVRSDRLVRRRSVLRPG